MVCFRLNTDAETIGALNVYAGRTHAFSDDAIRAGTLLAAHVAVAAATERDPCARPCRHATRSGRPKAS